jgi:hypothetical protein
MLIPANLALLWQVACWRRMERLMAVQALCWRRSSEEVEPSLPYSRHGRLWRWSRHSFFPSRCGEAAGFEHSSVNTRPVQASSPSLRISRNDGPLARFAGVSAPLARCSRARCAPSRQAPPPVVVLGRQSGAAQDLLGDLSKSLGAGSGTIACSGTGAK